MVLVMKLIWEVIGMSPFFLTHIIKLNIEKAAPEDTALLPIIFAVDKLTLLVQN